MSQAFHPLIGIVEVVLRNQLNSELSSHFADTDWIVNQKTGFMIDPSLRMTVRGRTVPNRFLLNEVEKVERRLRQLGLAVTSDKIISDQTFGFWTDLFVKYHYKLLAGRPIRAFKHLPPGTNRKMISDELTKIRRFRNRINHNEPICFLGGNIDFTSAQEAHTSIYNVLQWINPLLLPFIRDLDKVSRQITLASRI